ncbi:MAG: ABC transporter permease [Thermomicrobiales bacterium]|nr:ABC transporter permease [Thermomicrobiales bacterium]MCO5221136.1 ABC transporter permease [Thermomicrobiales bacterium]
MSVSSTATAPAVEHSPTPLLKRLLLKPEMGAIAGAVVVWIIFAILAGDRGFLSARGTANYLEVSAELGILAIAVALLMIGGEFDLSVGSTIGACGMIIAILSAEYGWNYWMAVVAALVVAVLIGVVNGIVVDKTGLPSFIVTLAMLFMIRGATIGVTREITGRTQVGGLKELSGFESAQKVFASDIHLFGTNWAISIVWWLVLTLVATWILLRTKFGNWIPGVGGGLQAARNLGVPTTRVKVTLFVCTAVAAWLVATIQVTSFGGADVLRGTYREFYAIVAVVIGGTLLTGGYGSALGAALGALIFGMVQQGIIFAGIDADWFQFVLGGMLLAAVLINRFVRSRAVLVR